MAGQGRPKDRVFEVKVDFGTVAKALGGFATFFHSARAAIEGSSAHHPVANAPPNDPSVRAASAVATAATGATIAANMAQTLHEAQTLRQDDLAREQAARREQQARELDEEDERLRPWRRRQREERERQEAERQRLEREREEAERQQPPPQQPGNAGPNLDELSESVILGLSFEEREGGGWLREDPLPTAVRAGPEARELLVKDCAHLCSASYEDLDEAARLGEARGFHLVRDLSDGDVKVFEKDGAAYIAWRGTDLDKSAERDLRAGISAFIGACFVHKRFHAARDFAKMVKERFNGRVHLTGHSLGGALAANAARWLGLFCDSFNAPSSMLSLGLAHVTSGMSAMANRTLYGHLVTLHRTPHDYVSMLNFTGGGRQRIHPEKDAANPHGMANFM